MQLIKFNHILLYLNKSKKQIQDWEKMVKGGSSLEKEPGFGTAGPKINMCLWNMVRGKVKM